MRLKPMLTKTRSGPPGQWSMAALAGCALLFLGTGVAYAQQIDRQQHYLSLSPTGEKSSIIATAFTDVWCSDVVLGSAVARLSWTISGDGLTQEKQYSLAAGTRAEVTIYPNGFERGQFNVQEPPTHRVEGGLSQPKLLMDAPRMEQADADYVILSDLQAGVLYKWRLAMSETDSAARSRPVSFIAPTCPVDYGKKHEPVAQQRGSGGNQ